jgi:hypothetical protein
MSAYLLRREVEIAEKEGKLKYPDENVNKNPQS